MSELLIDLYKTRDPFTGLGQFSMNFARALASHPRPGHELTFLLPKGSTFEVGEKGGRLEASPWMRYLPVLHRKYDLWHCLYQFSSLPPRAGSRIVLTVHDLNFLIEKAPAKAEQYRRKLQRELDRAYAVTAVSHFTRTQLEQHTDLRGKPVHVIHNGVRSDAFPDAVRPGFMDGRPFFSALAVFKEKKNLHILVPMMKHFPDHQLVISGNHDTRYGAEVKRAIAKAGLQQRVHLPGIVDDRTKFWLYKNSEAFLCPSLAEGFGMPVIEALSAGTPVFLSRSTSLPEIGAEVAHYFDELSPQAMADTLQKHLPRGHAQGAVASERAREHAARFNWDACSTAYQDLYTQVLGS